MSNLYDTRNEEEKFILIAIEYSNKNYSIEMNLNELEELAKTAGVKIVGKLIQKRESIDKTHYLGKGKFNELIELINITNATGIICDDELTKIQLKNINDILNIKIIDRTILILDIFAKHAKSSEGKIQVELAQLKYRLSHLIGLRKNLSKLGGGIGSKGPGEKKLELDKRYIKERINYLNKNLKDIEKHKNLLREKRLKNIIPIVSLIGYTNVGKSSIMNYLINTNILSENKLFSTLDTTTRKFKLSNGENILINDTIGFIQKLPHHLIKSFQTTLEELKYSDILIHVVDSSSPFIESHMNIVYSLLKELKVINKPIITVFNKSDKNIHNSLPIDSYATYTLSLSAKTGENMHILYTTIEKILKKYKKYIKVLIPFEKGYLLNIIYNSSEIKIKEYKENGIYLKILFNKLLINKLKKYIIN